MRLNSMLKIEGYFETIVILTLIGIFLYMLKSFLMAIFVAAALVFLLYKPYKKLVEKTKSETTSALFILFLLINIVLIPTYLVSNALINETSDLVFNGLDLIQNFEIDDCNYSFCSTISDNLLTIKVTIAKIIENLGDYIINSASSIFTSVSKIFINLFIFVLSFYFLLKDGDKFLIYVKRIIPMKNEYKNALFLRFRHVTEAVFIDNIFVAILQGTLVGLGLFIFGFKGALFWGIVSSFFAIVPMVGTAIIWFPFVVYLFLIGNYLMGIGFLLYGVIIVGLSDNLLRPLLLNKKIEVHPFLILLAIMGGLEVFGFFGIFLGPLIISLLISTIQLYKLEFN